MKRLALLLFVVFLMSSCAPSGQDEETYGPGEDGFVTSSDYISIEEPPDLYIQTGETLTQALPGGCTWEWKVSEEYWTAICKDSLHPLDCKELLTPVITQNNTAMLVFAVMPDSLTVRRWSDAQWGNTDVKAEEISVNGQSISLAPGGWVYEITGMWGDNGLYYGTASYYFYIIENA